ncbi:MAG: ribonuclease III [Acidobacteriaceae bacterium]
MTTRHDIAAETPKARARRPSQPDASANGKGDRASGEKSPPVPLDDRFFDYKFKDPSLLTLALTHSSLAYESNGEGMPHAGADNEQLEFIGDAVLGLVVAEGLYRRFPALREGDLTRLRASLVSSRNLAQVALRIQLGPMLRLGRGEEHSGGQKKPALLANALEAVIAAMYLDGGLAPARDFIDRHIVGPAEDGIASVLHSTEPFSGAVGDYKSALQERLQASGAGQPRYALTDQSGPDHQKRFRIEVRVADGAGGFLALATAEGTTKKCAEQEAARLAFASLLSGALLDVPPRRDASPAGSGAHVRRSVETPEATP